jgi:hypothetical protein
VERYQHAHQVVVPHLPGEGRFTLTAKVRVPRDARCARAQQQEDWDAPRWATSCAGRLRAAMSSELCSSWCLRGLSSSARDCRTGGSLRPMHRARPARAILAEPSCGA